MSKSTDHGDYIYINCFCYKVSQFLIYGQGSLSADTHSIMLQWTFITSICDVSSLKYLTYFPLLFFPSTWCLTCLDVHAFINVLHDQFLRSPSESFRFLSSPIPTHPHVLHISIPSHVFLCCHYQSFYSKSSDVKVITSRLNPPPICENKPMQDWFLNQRTRLVIHKPCLCDSTKLWRLLHCLWHCVSLMH